MPRNILACGALIFGFLALSSLFASGALAQEPQGAKVHVNPGDPAVTGTFIEPYRNAWEYSKRSPSGDVQILGRWTDQVSIEGEAGQEIVHRRQRFPSPAGVRVLENRFRRSDLAPISFEVSTDEGQTLQKVEFGPEQLRITQFGQGAVEKELAEPVFDWYLYGLLVASFPLEEGYRATFPALDQTLEPISRHLSVTGRESIAGPDGSPWPSWRVEADEGLTFWISKQAPYILHLTKKLDDGSTVVWELEKVSE